MKKRILSLVLVVMMLISLVPAGVLADGLDDLKSDIGGLIGGDAREITITTQPEDVYAIEGETVQFKIEGSIKGLDLLNKYTLKYFWYDTEEIDLNDKSVTDLLKIIAGRSMSTTDTLTINNVSLEDDGSEYRCILYYVNTVSDMNMIFSEPVTLYVEPNVICEEHDLVKVEETQATCAEEGNIEYYCCSICGKCFLDEAAQVATKKADCATPKTSTHGNISHVDAAEGTCCDKGHTEYWKCDLCGQMFSDAEGTAKTTSLAVQTDKVMTNHTNLVEYPAVPATCSAEGHKPYWYCDGCKDYYNDAEGKNEISKASTELDRDKTNHSALEEFQANPATCMSAGNIHYFYCNDCEGYFSDAAGKQSLSKVTLPKKDHVFQWNAYSENGAEWHEYTCTLCGTVENTGVHSGGEAGCHSKAVCEICGHEYGEFNPDNHINIERRIKLPATQTQDGICDIYCKDCNKIIEKDVLYSLKDECIHSIVAVEEVPAKCEHCEDGHGIKAHYKCEKCGTIFSDKDGKNEITDPDTLKTDPKTHAYTIGNTQIVNYTLAAEGYEYNEHGHYLVCKYCGEMLGGISTHSLSNGDATCCTGPVFCAICGYSVGDKNPNNHVGGTEVRGAVEATETSDGYTGDTYCKGCGEVIEYGHSYSMICSGGCKNLKFHAAKPSTCTEDGTVAYWECPTCHHYFKNADAKTEITDIVDKSTGHELHPGIDALTSMDVSKLLSNLKIDVNTIVKDLLNGDISKLKNLKFEDVLAEISLKDIDHCSNDEYHWLGCQKCGATLRDLKAELEERGIFLNNEWYEIGDKTPHSGGNANCKECAICAECGAKYGELGDHQYDIQVDTTNCTGENVQKYVCNICGEVDESRTTYIPAIGHEVVNGQCVDCGERISNPFYDVSSNSKYYTPVMWAYSFVPQITAGHYDSNHFDPSGDCTRGQVVTFLWRAAGCPEPVNLTNKFSDVSSSSKFYKAILWAAEQGITTGYGDGTFKPNKTVTRAEFVTFLWRYEGEPTPMFATNPFADVSDNSKFAKAILWALGEGITTGYDDFHFQPNKVCSRWQVVTFMYRAIHGQ